MINGHSSAAEWTDQLVAGLVRHIESLMADGLSYKDARAQAVFTSIAGPSTLRRVDAHFEVAA